jgi:hypothetical protein
LRGITSFSLIFLLLSLIYSAYLWSKVIATKYDNSIGEVCPKDIKRAIYKMGPGYDYMMVGEKLYVNTGDGKWLRLRYERR